MTVPKWYPRSKRNEPITTRLASVSESAESIRSRSVPRGGAQPIVRTEQLRKEFPAGPSGLIVRKRQTIKAVDRVDLEIASGETLGLVGESGSGKSTLGRLILRLIEPTSGRIHFDGYDLRNADRPRMRRLRRDMQIIFQDPFASLDPRFRVGDIIAEPLLIHGNTAPSEDSRLPLEKSGRARLEGRVS